MAYTIGNNSKAMLMLLIAGGIETICKDDTTLVGLTINKKHTSG